MRKEKPLAEKAVLLQNSIALGVGTPNTRGKSKAAFEKILEESKKKKGVIRIQTEK